jgi:hypothetical protein
MLNQITNSTYEFKVHFNGENNERIKRCRNQNKNSLASCVNLAGGYILQRTTQGHRDLLYLQFTYQLEL